MLSQSQLERLRDDVLRLLGEVGMRIEHEKMQGDMLAAGCELSPLGRVRISKKLIDEFVKSQERSRTIDDDRESFINRFGIVDYGHFLIWTGNREMEEQRMKRMLRTTVFDCGPTAYYDYPSGQTLPVDSKIFTDVHKWAHSVPEIGYIANWYRQDAPPQTERIESLAMALKITDKVGGIEAIDPKMIKYIQAVGELMTGKPGESAYLAGSQCVTPPLAFDYRSAEEAVERARLGIAKYHVATMMVIGLNTPVTPAGAIVMMAAEILGGMVAVWTQNNDADITGRALASMLDMRTADVTSATTESSIANLGVKELFNAFFGGHIRVDTFFTTAARRPGLQAVVECFNGMHRNMAVQKLTTFSYPGVGTIGNGGVGSPTQAVLDIEIKKALFVPEEICVSDETVPFELIRESVEAGENMIGAEHTIAHFREMFSSPLFKTDDPTTSPWKSDEKAILDEADQIWREQTKKYQPVERSTDWTRELDKIVASAKKELIGS